MRIYKYIITILLICSFSNGYTLEFAKYAGEFLSTGVGARALGMGGAYSAVGGDATFGYWNPAGLSSINYPELTAMHSRRFGGVVNYDYLGFASPFHTNSSLAVNIIRLAVDDIPIPALPNKEAAVGNDNQPYIDRYVSDAEYAVFLSYAQKRTEKLALGANVKFIHKGTGDNSAWGLGFDIGVIWNPVNKLLVGANLMDITSTVLAWDTGTKELITPSLKTGLAFPLSMDFAKARLMMAADLDIRFEGREFASQMNIGAVSIDPRIGAELLFRNVVALRAGRDDLGSFTAGAGLILPRLDIDYAFLGHDELETTHRISLRVRLEEPKFLRK